MGGSTIQKNKPHKARFATKGQRNTHFKAIKNGGGARAFKGGAPNRQIAKSQRVQRAKALRDQKRAQVLMERRMSGVSSGRAPRIVALIGLSGELNMRSLKRRFLSLCAAADGRDGDHELAASNLIGSTNGGQQQQDWMEFDDNANEVDDERRNSGKQEGHNSQSLVTVVMSRHRSRMSVIESSSKDLLRCLEIVKIADMILFFVPVVQPGGSECIDKSGIECLTVMRAQGLPAVCGVIVGFNKAMGKKMGEAKKNAIAAVHAQLTSDVKVFAVDSNDESRQLVRHVAENRISLPSWRSQRPYVVAERIEVLANQEEVAPGSGDKAARHGDAAETETSTCRLLVSGYLRGRAMSVNQLIHVSGLGDFQMERIEGLSDPTPLNPRSRRLVAEKNTVAVGEAADMAVDIGNDMEDTPAGNVMVLAKADPNTREPLVVTNTPDPLAGEQTWPTESELAEASERARKMGKVLRKKRRLKGLSDYQAAWIVDSDDDGEGRENDREDDEIERADGDENYGEDQGNSDSCEIEDDGEGDGESEMWTDEQMGTDIMDGTEDGDEGLTPAQREAEMRRVKAAASRDDEEFPDEVDTPTDIPARERFAKYRGLKSLRTSPWDPKESLPPEYAKIFAFDDYKRTLNHVHAKADLVDRMEVPGTVEAGTYVQLHVVGVPHAEADALVRSTVGIGVPTLAVGLLQHESKMSVLHFGLKKWDGCCEPIKSKEKLTFHIGFRQFSARPIFSTDDMQMDKHKFERFLHPGRHVVGSVYAPIMFPPAPVLVFKEKMGCRKTAGEDGPGSMVSGGPVSVDGSEERGMGKEPQLVAMGTLRGPDPDRIILKKIVLSGYPLRVHKKKAVVRFMFHNPEDVRWFRPLELWTKYGRRGRIREPVGTHGNMKCMFDGVVQQRDAVCVSLYKRVYPKWPGNEDGRKKPGR